MTIKHTAGGTRYEQHGRDHTFDRKCPGCQEWRDEGERFHVVAVGVSERWPSGYATLCPDCARETV